MPRSLTGLCSTMYVCVCHAITDRQIREVVDRGADSLGAVQACLPVASCCGSCEKSACELIEERVSEIRERPVAA
jgi:bacterioferritin-associated ferredoxin